MATVNKKMTAIADEVRSLLGVTGVMGLDTIESNLNTANSSVTAAMNSLMNKGAVIPSDANVTSLSSIIESIQIGGGLKYTSGKISFNSDYYVSSGDGTAVTHNLGVVPEAIFIRISASRLDSIVHLMHYFGTRKNGIFNPDGNLNSSIAVTGIGSNSISVAEVSSNDFTSSSGKVVKSATTTAFYFAPPSTMMAKAGEEYVWYAIGGV